MSFVYIIKFKKQNLKNKLNIINTKAKKRIDNNIKKEFKDF